MSTGKGRPVVEDFEKSMEELEKIVNKLEGGGITLDEAIELFQRGMALAKTCKTKLDEAELRVSQLVKEKDALFSEKPAAGGESRKSASADSPDDVPF